jgi:hypothetical protein
MRSYVEGVLDNVRQAVYRPFYLVWTSSETECTDCAYNEFTQSADNITCEACGGTGKVLSWTSAEIHGRIQHMDMVALSAAGLPPGIDVGDAVVYVSEDMKEAIEEHGNSHNGYIFLDGDRYKPYGINPTGVGHRSEWRVELKRTTMSVNANGY